jgi:hypothetical protein
MVGFQIFMAVRYSELEQRLVWYMVIIISEKPAAFTFYSYPEVEARDPRYLYSKKDSTGSLRNVCSRLPDCTVSSQNATI